MSLYTYRVFETVVKEGSFINAAAVLNLTPSAVSHAIAKLEDECGFALFTRSRTKVQLTSNGERLLPIVGTILRSEDALNQEVAQINGLEKGVLRIGTMESVTRKWLPDVIRNFKKKYPSIEVELMEGIYKEIERWLNLSMVDMAFMSSNYSCSFKITPLYKDQMVCITSPDFKSKDPEYITVDEIKDQSIMAKKEGDDSDVLNIMKKYGIDKKQSFKMDANESIIKMASCGFGIGILPELICDASEVKNAKVFHFKPEEYRVIGLAYSNDKTRPYAALEFENEVRAFLKEQGFDNI